MREVKNARAHRIMRNLTEWIDPKLEPYRPPRRNSRLAEDVAPPISEPTPVNTESIPEVPDYLNSRAELMTVIRSAPFGVFSESERRMMETLLGLDHLFASEIIHPKEELTMVEATETLGPLTLDRLYKTGLSHFPVIDSHDQIIGMIQTSRLNQLQDRRKVTAEEIIDENVYYIRSDYSLTEVLHVFLRSPCFMLLSVDRYGKVNGFTTLEFFFKFLFGEVKTDEFNRDFDRLSVAKRVLNRGEARNG